MYFLVERKAEIRRNTDVASVDSDIMFGVSVVVI